MVLDFCWFNLNMKVFDIIMCVNWLLKHRVFSICWSKVLILIRNQLIVLYKENFHGKISINSRPLFIIFNYLFRCPKANFGPQHWQRVSLAYLMLIIALYLIWPKGDRELRNDVESQSPTEYMSRVWTGNLQIWSWSANSLCVLILLNSYKYSQYIQEFSFGNGIFGNRIIKNL